jgi:hypothetical protein
MVLLAQSVPSATAVPCIATLPAGWRPGDLHVQRGRSTFSLDSDVGGERAVTVTFTDDGAVGDAQAVPSDELGLRRFERPERLVPQLRTTRYYVFPGGCARYEFRFRPGATPALVFAADQALGFQHRDSLVRKVDRQYDLKLCGAGAHCPGGDGS